MQSDISPSANMILVFLTCFFFNCLVYGKAPAACCSDITNEKCQRSCHQIYSQGSPIQQMQMLLSSAEGCPAEMSDFWQCINNTLPAVKLMAMWPGKTCCDMAKGKDCRKKCNLADSKEAMLRACRENTESSLFSCVQLHEDGNLCCSRAKGTSCGIVCRGVYQTDNNYSKQTRITLQQHCGIQDRRVSDCVLKQLQPLTGNNQKYLPCCDKTQSVSCKTTCKTVLRTIMSKEDTVEELIKDCSKPQPTDPFWQCFLNQAGGKKNETAPMYRIDNAKLQCCGKASSNRCRDLCTQTYKKGWSYHSEFEGSCSYIQPVSTVEASMHNCLTDVDQPCRLGCTGLSFCSNFNHRPTELFRSCTPEADEAAEKVYNSWKKGVIHLSQMTIPVKDISQCKPAMWKAIACALEIKPCSTQQSLITLCKEDCLLILNQCVNPNMLTGEQTVPALCNALPSKNTPGACVSMDQYLVESPYRNRQEVRHPCNPNPCAGDEVCLVRRRKCKESHDCHSYVCHKACPLGQASKVLVPKGTDVRLANHDSDHSNQEDCYLACYCGSRGVVENCKPLACMKRDACVMGHDNSREHGVQFSVDGSKCMCFSGKLLCARRTCQPDNQSPLYTGMPGNCPTEYEPVCGANGKTYPNMCMAKCAGVSNIKAHKACSDEDVCAHKLCPVGSRCVPRPQLCLNDMHGDYCPQFECVNVSGICNGHHHDPVCSSTGEEFSNTCLLYAHGKTLGYRGHCQSSCSTIGVVCGHDGETYTNECAAWAARVTVDYTGKCKAFGNLTGYTGKTMTCNQVECPPLHPDNCEGITPPGGCCPICAAQLRLLWDPRLMTMAANHSKSKIISAMDVLTSLSDHVTVLECDVFGYVSINGELIVIFGPSVPQPTALQVEACQNEGERIHNLIQMGSPNIASYLTLSPFLLVSMERSTVSLTVMLDTNYQSLQEMGDKDSSGSNQLTSVLLILILCQTVKLWNISLHL